MAHTINHFDLQRDAHHIPAFAEILRDCIMIDGTMATFLPPLDPQVLLSWAQTRAEETRTTRDILKRSWCVSRQCNVLLRLIEAIVVWLRLPRKNSHGDRPISWQRAKASRLSALQATVRVAILSDST